MQVKAGAARCGADHGYDQGLLGSSAVHGFEVHKQWTSVSGPRSEPRHQVQQGHHEQRFAQRVGLEGLHALLAMQRMRCTWSSESGPRASAASLARWQGARLEWVRVSHASVAGQLKVLPLAGSKALYP